jgi:hypothetical protein
MRVPLPSVFLPMEGDLEKAVHATTRVNNRAVRTVFMLATWKNFWVFTHQALTRYFPSNDRAIGDKPLSSCHSNGQLTMVDDANVICKDITATMRSGVFRLILGSNPNLDRASRRRYHTDKYRAQSDRTNQTGLNCSKACKQSKQ